MTDETPRIIEPEALAAARGRLEDHPESERSTEDRLCERGFVAWHSSGEDEGPDVGLSLGLGAGQMLWLGELATATLADAGIDVKETGDGWWFAMFGPRGTAVAALVVDQEAARTLFDAFEMLVRGHAEKDAALSAIEPQEPKL